MPKILIVEDDKFLLRVYSAKLEKEGIETVLIEKGSGVMDLVKSENPDVIALDLIIPEKDGFELLKELKTDPVTKDVPVVIISALRTDEDKKRAKDLGAVDYIVKSDLSFGDAVEILKKYT